jgi:ATP-dependent RNA helicase DDX5/DBP2
VAPTRELALQIAGEAEKFAPAVRARVVVLYGGTPKGPQVGELRQGADIVIATPGRLNDLCAGDPKRGLSPSISLEAVTYLVLDEADQMLDMGFEPAIREIVARCPKIGAPEEGGGAGGARGGTRRQTLFFTATWPKKVQASAASFTSKAAVQVRIGQGAGGDKLTLNKNVTHEVVMSEFKEKAWALQSYIKRSLGPSESAVVFASTKGACDFLEQKMREAFKGTWCRALHGDKEQWEREEMLGEFRAKVAGGQQSVLVATDVAARGLDIPGISLVVVYDFSNARQPAGIAVENYVHRVGRTGRAGKTGRALTLWSSEDKGAPELVKLLEDAGQKVPKELKDIAAWARPAGKGGRSHGWAKSWW